MTENIDEDVRRYARLFDTLDAHLPISDDFEAKDLQKEDRWWGSQRQHMGCYFAGRPKRVGNLSARAAYNALQHAEGIMWVVEALDTDGEHTDRLVGLSEDVFGGKVRIPRRMRAGALRTQLPWSLIQELGQHRLDSRP